MTVTPPNQAKSVWLFGATGTIGRAAAKQIVAAGHRLTCVVRPDTDTSALPDAADLLHCEVGDYETLNLSMADAVVSCLASRTGVPDEAWAIDYSAHLDILCTAQTGQVPQFVQLSAICVQRPTLAFQQAKLAFEAALTDSGLTYSIVRPTAFFKSLSGQVARVQAGKPFLLFGDGEVTACKPISDKDLGRYLTLCLTDPALQNRILPIGGPGPAITPRAQGEMIFRLLDMGPKFKFVPVRLMDAIISGLSLAGRIVPPLHGKAELAKIGRYYATESMLVWDGTAYDADATPSFGVDTLEGHYRALIAGDVTADLGDHAVFSS